MIRFEKVFLAYGDRTVLRDVTLQVPPGGRVALMGPSGCGKTSLLQLAAGLKKPTSGQVISHARRPAYAFQEPRLLPRLTVAQNAQRVNLARALAYEGDLLLLDEPLKELDEARQDDILSLLRDHTAGRTLLVTTHDPHVARVLAERVFLWRDGTFVRTK